ncbi:MAG: CinA family protein [Clostridia bacterium]|nr:CinA family protein [Clostridia bacterium]
MTIERQLVELLTQKNMKIATAESCTGGMISELITNIAGASAVLELGVCSYSNRIKNQVLGVPQEILDEYTELSTQTAEEMAKGVMRLSGADIAVSTTGLAGPGGGTEEDPVGTVYVALASASGVVSEKKNFNEDGVNDRNVIRRRCADYVMQMAIYYLNSGNSGEGCS